MERLPRDQAAIIAALRRRGLVPISGGSPCTPLGSTTAILSLCKPAEGEVGWADAVNGNFDILDGLFLAGQLLKTSKGGLGFDASAAANGTVPIGNGAGFTLNPLTQGSGIVITNAAGSITIATSGAPGGGSIFAAGTLEGSGGGAYSTTSAGFVDVDAVNLKVSVVVPGAAKFLLVQATFSVEASVITDNAAHVRFLAAGTAVGAGVIVNNALVNPVGTYTLYGVVTNPTNGAQTIALQFAGDGANAFTISNPAVEGTPGGTVQQIRARMSYVVTN